MCSRNFPFKPVLIVANFALRKGKSSLAGKVTSTTDGSDDFRYKKSFDPYRYPTSFLPMGKRQVYLINNGKKKVQDYLWGVFAKLYLGYFQLLLFSR